MSTSALAASRITTRQFYGWAAVFGSAFCFYLATLIIRWSHSTVDIETSFFVFSRFLLGFTVVCLSMAWNRQRLQPRRYHYLLGRTIANTVAVFCFYKAVAVSSVAEANILNMTYPLFVALFSWLFLKKQRDAIAVVIVMIAFVGVWLVLSPGSVGLGFHNFWGLASGFCAAFAIIYLNISRQYHDSQTILFFMFGVGLLIMLVFFRHQLFIPDRSEFFFLLTCSVAGVLGQYLLTYGFFFVTAVEGAVISSTRILLAALLGPILAADPALSAVGWFGALLIFGSNVGLALRRKSQAH